MNDYVACRLPASRQHPTPRVAYLVILKEAMVLTEPSSSGGGMAVARSIAPLHLVESAIDRQDGRVVRCELIMPILCIVELCCYLDIFTHELNTIL